MAFRSVKAAASIGSLRARSSGAQVDPDYNPEFEGDGVLGADGEGHYGATWEGDPSGTSLAGSSSRRKSILESRGSTNSGSPDLSISRDPSRSALKPVLTISASFRDRIRTSRNDSLASIQGVKSIDYSPDWERGEDPSTRNAEYNSGLAQALSPISPYDPSSPHDGPGGGGIVTPRRRRSPSYRSFKLFHLLVSAPLSLILPPLIALIPIFVWPPSRDTKDGGYGDGDGNYPRPIMWIEIGIGAMAWATTEAVREPIFDLFGSAGTGKMVEASLIEEEIVDAVVDTSGERQPLVGQRGERVRGKDLGIVQHWVIDTIPFAIHVLFQELVRLFSLFIVFSARSESGSTFHTLISPRRSFSTTPPISFFQAFFLALGWAFAEIVYRSWQLVKEVELYSDVLDGNGFFEGVDTEDRFLGADRNGFRGRNGDLEGGNPLRGPPFKATKGKEAGTGDERSPILSPELTLPAPGASSLPQPSYISSPALGRSEPTEPEPDGAEPSASYASGPALTLPSISTTAVEGGTTSQVRGDEGSAKEGSAKEGSAKETSNLALDSAAPSASASLAPSSGASVTGSSTDGHSTNGFLDSASPPPPLPQINRMMTDTTLRRAEGEASTSEARTSHEELSSFPPYQDLITPRYDLEGENSESTSSSSDDEDDEDEDDILVDDDELDALSRRKRRLELRKAYGTPLWNVPPGVVIVWRLDALLFTLFLTLLLAFPLSSNFPSLIKTHPLPRPPLVPTFILVTLLHLISTVMWARHLPRVGIPAASYGTLVFGLLGLFAVLGGWGAIV